MQVGVLTYNLGNGMADPLRLTRMLEQTEVDIVGVQELAAQQASVLAGALSELLPYRVLIGTGFSGKGLMSRYPIVSHEPLHLYPDRPDLRCVLDVEGTHLQVLVAHPPPPRLIRARIAFDARAIFQLGALAERAIDHSPTVLVGDLNMTPRNPVYAQFASLGLVDAFASAGTGRGWTLPRRVGQTARFQHGLHRVPLRAVARVDYIWCTPDVEVVSARVGDDAGSDHLPVLARLILPR